MTSVEIQKVISYRLYALVPFVPDGPCFLLPVWENKGGLFVHEYGEDGIITSFFPFDPQTSGVGSRMLWVGKKKDLHLNKKSHVGIAATHAVRFANGEILVGKRGKVAKGCRLNINDFKKSPVLKVRVAEFIGDLGILNESIETAKEYISNKDKCLNKSQILFDYDMRLNWLRKRAQSGIGTSYESWNEITPEFLSCLLSPTNEEIGLFLRGSNPQWNLVYSNKLPEFDEVKWVSEASLERENAVIILTGPTAHGKTTGAMQICKRLLDNGFRLFSSYNRYPCVTELISTVNGPIALLIDDCSFDYIRENIPYFKQRKDPIKVVVTARDFEIGEKNLKWLQAQSRVACKRLDSLSENDINSLSALLKDIFPHIQTQIAFKTLSYNKGKDLLATLLLTTFGEGFNAALKDMLANISGKPAGKSLVLLLAIVSGLESRHTTSGKTFPALYELVEECLYSYFYDLNSAIESLYGEITLSVRSPRGYKQIFTRHPLVAERLWSIITSDYDALIPAKYVDMIILDAISRLNSRHNDYRYQRYFAIIPNFWLNDIFTFRDIIHSALQNDPGNVAAWQTWAIAETTAGNLGNLDTINSGRWLFNHAITIAPSDVPAWQAWAIAEAEAGELGQIDHPHSARWLFKMATELDPSVNSLQAWGKAEADEGNLGSIDEKYTARWLFKTAIDRDSSNIPSLQAWGKAEADCGNYGDIHKRYSARWLFKIAVDHAPFNVSLLVSWAHAEFRYGNIGTIEGAYSARWLFLRAVKVEPANANTFSFWGKVEADYGNFGDFEQEYSARWLFLMATQIDPTDVHALYLWAKAEAAVGNIGQIETPFTARWLLNKATEIAPSYTRLWQLWADIEIMCGNLGNNSEKFSGMWLRQKGNQVLQLATTRSHRLQ